MPIILRDYQENIERRIQSGWREHTRNILAVLPTGAGKTVLFSEIIRKHVGPSVVIAHRQELLSQISRALARDGVRHKIIGPKAIIKFCIYAHVEDTGRSYYDPNAIVAVAGVDTLVRRLDDLTEWGKTITMWVQDEAHHITKNNKWGKVIALFPNALGLGVTATTMRTDGKGLGAHAAGVFHSLIVGPDLRALINASYLTDYKIFAPQSDIDLANVPISSATGDFTPVPLKAAVRKSHIVGDVVANYLKFAKGKIGVTFATDVETAGDIAAEYNRAGIPAEVISAKTPDRIRMAILEKFKTRQILQVVNVDIFGEGFDLPAIEVISMARPTASYVLFVQQFGRSLRILDGKERALIIDHVGNIIRHGLPDHGKIWTLNNRDGKGGSGESPTPLRSCPNPECLGVYERYYKSCPYCGYTPQPASRSSPEFVDGDLAELDEATLARLRGARDKIDLPVEEYRSQLVASHCPVVGQLAHVKRHTEQQTMQAALRTSMAWWAGIQASMGRDMSQSDRRFYHYFGIDKLSAQGLGIADALELAEKINSHIGAGRV